jgi:glutamate formiminotransferase
MSSEKIAIVHAYADGTYDRSSFHLAGTLHPTTEVASLIAVKAIEGLEQLPRDASQEKSRHPFVGLVDHISVMPLRNSTSVGSWVGDESASPHGKASRMIGKQLEEIGVEVYYYGDANSEGIPLAQVRREQTNFFRSGGLETTGSEAAHGDAQRSTGVATVGAPSTFVENFNIRLTSKCDITAARSLTRFLRQRDGGLQGVEGLTLPYSRDRFEMAGNLLQPDVGSAEAVTAKLEEWVKLQLHKTSFHNRADLVEKAYRVGTTADQCLHVLTLSESSSDIRQHDDQVMNQFRDYLYASD